MGYNLRKKGYPIVDGVSRSEVSPTGGTRLTVSGRNLWGGVHNPGLASDLAPPVVICVHDNVCDVDFFESDMDNIVCTTRPKDGTRPAVEGKDPQVRRALRLSETLCASSMSTGIEIGSTDDPEATPARAGMEFPHATDFVKTGTGWRNGNSASETIAYLRTAKTADECKNETLKRGGQAFTWRSNYWKWGQPCWIYREPLLKPSQTCRGCHVFEAYSLVPPIVSAFFKFNGTYVGGTTNSRGNYYGRCYRTPWECGVKYEPAITPELVQADPPVVGIGHSLRVIGTLLGAGLADDESARGTLLLTPRSSL
jgi:hypothetical protein